MSIYRAVALTITLAVISAGFTTALHAGPKGKPGKAGKSGFDIDVDAGLSVVISAGISAGEARRLASSHELTGQKPLPPGIRKNLARGKPLPPGIQKSRVPGSFTDELPGHEGYEWRQAGTDLVLVASGSLVISDVLRDVFD